MKTRFAILLWAVVTLLGAVTGRSAVGTQPPGSGGSGTVTTGSVTVLAPLVLSGTEIQLPPQLMNLSASATNRVYWNPATNIASAWSNLANNTKVIISAGEYTLTPSKYLSNGLGAINVYSKTNIAVEIDNNATLNGSSALGELLVMTNCDNVVIRGGIWRGRVATNWWTADISHVWHGILLHNNANVWFDGLQLENHMDHGIGGLGAQSNHSAGNTNNIWLTRLKGSYIGSYRTNAGAAVDGTFIVPDGPWNIVEVEGYANMRDVEPYSEGDAAPNRWNGGMVINSRFINTIDRSILSAGSTNNHHFLIAGNYFYREPGFTRYTSNYTATADYVWWNGGYGWTIKDNVFGGHAARAIYITSGVRDGTVTGNKFIDLTNTLGSSGHSINVEEAYNMRINNNTTIGGEGLPLYLFGLRDSEVKNNWMQDAFGEVGIQIATFGGPVTSNVWFEGNTIRGITNAIWDQDLSGSQNLTFVNNRIEGATGNAYNLGDTTASEYLVRTSDSHGGTNQFASIGDLNVSSNALYSSIGSGSAATNGTAVIASGTLVSSNRVDVGSAQQFSIFQSGGFFQLTDNTSGAALISADDSSGEVFLGTDSITPLISFEAPVNAGGNTITNVASVVINGASTVAGYTILSGTNDVPVVTQAAASNSIPVTNIVGLIHRAAAVYIEVDCNREQDIQITNRLAANTIVNWLNASQGQVYQLRFTGAASGGSDYYVTNTFPSGWLVVNQSTNAAPLAVQLPVLVADGTGGELNMRAYKHVTGTNLIGALINQYAE